MLLCVDLGCAPAAVAAETGVTTLRVLAERGADLNFKDAITGTLLHSAVRSKQLEILQYLQAHTDLFKTVHLDLASGNVTPLHNTCRAGQLHLVR